MNRNVFRGISGCDRSCLAYQLRQYVLYSLEHQRKILSKLSYPDEMISNLDRMIESLKKNKQLIIKSDERRSDC